MLIFAPLKHSCGTRCRHIQVAFIVSAILINQPHWGSNRVGYPKGPGGFAWMAKATRSAALYFFADTL